LIATQASKRPLELNENDSYLELEQIYSKQGGTTEDQRRKRFCKSVSSARQKSTLFSPTSGHFGTTDMFDRSEVTSPKEKKTPESFWQNKEVQN